jgi:hypothetical protein
MVGMHSHGAPAPRIGIVTVAKRFLKERIDSRNPFWWTMIEAASLCDTVAGWLTLPFALARHWRDLPLVLRLRGAVADGIPVIAFDQSREHFSGMYEPITKELSTRYGCFNVVPNGHHLENEMTIHSCWSLFVPWSAYLSCWFPTHHPNVLDAGNARLAVELYHGAGAAYMSDAFPTHSSILFRRELAKFNVHFATGPETKKTAASFGPGHECYEVGYPKTDFLFRDGTPPSTVTEDCDFADKKPLVVYAPHHHASGSLSRYGAKTVRALLRADINLIVKFHGLLAAADIPMHGVRREIEGIAANDPRVRIARETEPGHYYKLADAVVGDTGSNSTGFEATLCGKPAILIRSTNVHILEDARSFEGAMAKTCDTVDTLEELPAAIAKALLLPEAVLRERRTAASAFLYNPGSATRAVVDALASLIEPAGTRPDTGLNISVVIPAYNEEKWIGECLRSVLALEDGSIAEIIVVDNGSTDRTADIARSFPRVTVVSETKKGVTRARQKGLDVAKGDLYAAIDSDVRIDRLWVAAVKRRFSSEPDLVSLGGPYQYYDLIAWKRAVLWTLEKTFATARALFRRPKMVYARGGNTVYRVDALRTVGGFSVGIDFYGEDRDTLQRLRQAGRSDFDNALCAGASARRLNREGFFRTILIAKANAVWQHLMEKPLIVKKESDWR